MKYYYNIIEKRLKDIKPNDKLLIIINNYFNPLDDFSHIIKKYNLHITIVVENEETYNTLINATKGEECEKNLLIKMNIKETIIKYDKIIIFHLYSIDYLKNLLESFIPIINENSEIFIYCSLSNLNDNDINYKNMIRENINIFTDYKIGKLLSFSQVLSEIDNQHTLKIQSISVYKKNNYIIYGDNIVYQLLLVALPDLLSSSSTI